MALVIPLDFGQLAFHLRRAGDSKDYVCTWGFKVGAPPFTFENALLYAQELRFIMRVMACDNETLSRMVLRVNIGGAGLQVFDIASATVGTRTAAIQNCQNIAVLIGKRTNVGGRQGSGRLFWPSSLDTDTNGVGELSATALAVFGNGFTAVLDKHEPPASTPFNVDGMYVLHNVPPNVVPPPARVEFLQVSPLVATQRRRLR